MEELKITQGYVPGALGWVAGLHGTYYSQNWNFGLVFEAKAATQLADFLTNYETDKDGFWLVWQAAQMAGSITIVGPRPTDSDQSARLRWFILDPAYQGRGIGKTLLKTALDFCREKWYKRVYLTTFKGLDTARYLYEQAGFVLCEEIEGRQWGSKLIEQKFELWLDE